MSRITRRTVIPVNQITPLTYRDGVTYIELLTELSDYIKSILHPSLQHTVDQLVADVEAQMDKHHDQYVDGVQEFQRIHDAFMSDVNAKLIALNDTAVSDLLDDDTSLLRQSLHQHFVAHVETNQRVVIATDPSYGEPYTKQSVINAMDAAEALGQNTIVHFPAGVYDVGEGLNLDGYSIQIHGDGAVGDTRYNMVGTIFHAPNQRGPVLDFRGWIPPGLFLGKAIHENFRLVGSGESDPSKQNTGMTFSELNSTVIRDVAIEKTGGPGLYGQQHSGNSVYICDFERIVVMSPVDATVNDVPYYHFHGANGNRFRGIGMRSITNGNSCGKSGAFILEDYVYRSGTGGGGTTGNLIDAPWIEFIQIPPGGTAFAIYGGSGNKIINQYIVDQDFMDDHSDASFITIAPSRLQSENGEPILTRGANTIMGGVPGSLRNNSSNYGVKLLTHGNHVSGTKGYPGQNVYLAPGVRSNYIVLGGSGSLSVQPGVIDESGNDLNTIVDPANGFYKYAHSNAVGSTDHKFSVGSKLLASDQTRRTGVSGNVTIDATEHLVHRMQITGSTTITDIVGPRGAEVTVVIQQGAGSPHTVSWPGNVRFEGNTPPELSTLTGWFDMLSFKLVEIVGGERWVETSRTTRMRHN